MGRIDDLDFLKKEERWAGYANFMEEQGLDPITGEKQSADYTPLFSGPKYEADNDASGDADLFGGDIGLDAPWVD